MTLSTIYIVSGGNGASGELIVDTVLAQFPDSRVETVKRPFVREQRELEEIVTRAESEQAIIVHTLVHSGLRRALEGLGEAHDVPTVDLMGELIKKLSETLGVAPLGRPGRYRQLHLDYYARVEAIEFALRHDDGQHLAALDEAEIVITGPSRVGKTPLSIYLSVLGWKTANIPLVPEVPPPRQLFEIDRRRVLGLILEPQHLLAHRKRRQHELRMTRGAATYADPNKIFEEVEAVERIYKKAGFTSLNVTGQPIESTANQVIDIIRNRFGEAARKLRE
jgi:[pyruvate, water dikinase]-phosphate phosphotransferase / [pyruvate, water dikinase] kinase